MRSATKRPRRLARFPVAAFAAATVLVAAASVGSAASGWIVVASVNDRDAQGNQLQSISCASSTSCVAVGARWDASTDLQDTLTETWNGTVWSLASPGVPGTISEGELSGVSCTSSTNCVGVGDYQTGTPPHFSQTLIERWNGRAWSTMPSPNASDQGNLLFGVSCTSWASCVAVGYYQPEDSLYPETLVESWNGTSWSIVPSPNPGTQDDFLTKVSCTSSISCVATGMAGVGDTEQPLIETWDGKVWTAVAQPDPAGKSLRLEDVSCDTAVSCVAVGYSVSTKQGSADRTLTKSWDGTSWTAMPSPNHDLENNALESVSCTSPISCVAVGYYQGAPPETPTDNTFVLVESWNGVSWAIVASQNRGVDDMLFDVFCTAAANCTAVGGYYATHQPASKVLVETGPA